MKKKISVLILIFGLLFAFTSCEEEETPFIPDPVEIDTDMEDDDEQTADIVYEVGDVGPAGGIVFLDKGEESDGWRYMEIAPFDIELGLQFGCLTLEIEEAQNFEVGFGLVNSLAILEAHNELEDYYTNPEQCSDFNDGTVAAKVCLEYELNDFDDWFLPSQDELLLVHAAYYEVGLGEFNLERLYWTSSEFNESGAVMVDFAKSPDEGHFGIGGKNFGGEISVTRPIRYF